ncbi:hypothetical protein MFM001_12920 [Mycobacterium sp. MFM001]|nr:hypothetical protein MFM001_12920 [Mycobacterium sp. MFM001]
MPLATTLLCEVRTFLEPPCDGPRPPGQLVRATTVLATETAGQLRGMQLRERYPDDGFYLADLNPQRRPRWRRRGRLILRSRRPHQALNDQTPKQAYLNKT